MLRTRRQGVSRQFSKMGNSGMSPRNLLPETSVYIGEHRTGEVSLTLVEYDKTTVNTQSPSSPDHCFPFKPAPTVTWLHVNGIHQADIIRTVGQQLHLHPLLIEDVLNTTQRSKIEDYDDVLFLVLKIVEYDAVDDNLRIEQLSLVLGNTFVVSFQEDNANAFTPIVDRIRQRRGRIRQMGVDYLLYSLIDAVADNYFVLLEGLEQKIATIDDMLFMEPSSETLQLIHTQKREIVYLHKPIRALREIAGSLERSESALISQPVKVYLRDVHDHSIQIMEEMESLQEILFEVREIYLSNVSNKTNEVMKLLTVFTAIFIPLTFITGIYGMNFINMPELSWRWGYGIIWLVLLSVGFTLLLLFRRMRLF